MSSVCLCSRGEESTGKEESVEEQNDDLGAARSWAERVELLDPEN